MMRKWMDISGFGTVDLHRRLNSLDLASAFFIFWKRLGALHRWIQRELNRQDLNLIDAENLDNFVDETY